MENSFDVSVATHDDLPINESNLQDQMQDDTCASKVFFCIQRGQAVMRKVVSIELKTTYDQQKTTNLFIKKLLSLPLLPASHILPTFQNLKSSATTLQLNELPTLTVCVSTTKSGVFSSEVFSVKLFVPTLIQKVGIIDSSAGQAATNFISKKLVLTLKCEAETVCVDITVQLVNKQKLTCYQGQTYKKTQQKLEIWDQYEAKQLKTSTYLKASGKLIGKYSQLHIFKQRQ
ncbi:hypothetical protein ScPMuIL_008430 [Solemya velum]